jgi:hypothetical protein
MMSNEGHDKLADLLHGMLRDMCPTELTSLMQAVERIVDDELRACTKLFLWPVSETVDPEAELWDFVARAHNYYTENADTMRRLNECEEPEDHFEYISFVEKDEAWMAECVSRFRCIIARALEAQRQQMTKVSVN